MKKMFLEENTGEYTATISAAKRIALQKRKKPYISRVWLDGDKIIGRAMVYAFGKMICKIKTADAVIAIKLKKQL